MDAPFLRSEIWSTAACDRNPACHLDCKHRGDSDRTGERDLFKRVCAVESTEYRKADSGNIGRYSYDRLRFFFALNFVTPVLQFIIPQTEIFNALSAGIVVGIMIIPIICSLSEDAMMAVPNSLRNGAYALGSTKLEVALKIVVPAALSGIIASFVLGLSRAVGETMIVTLAAGNLAQMAYNPLQSIQTLTAYIVSVSSGDTSYGSVEYMTIYAVGITLFVMTLAMNILARTISKRFREEY